MKSHLKLFGLAVAALGLTAPFASALPSVTYTLATGNTGTGGLSPTYPSPYGTVQVTLTGPTTASVVFTGATTGGFTYLFGGTKAIDVNVNGSFTATSLAPVTLLTPGSGNVASFGLFNLTIDNSDGASSAASPMSFTLTNTGGTWATPGSVLTNNGSGFVAAAHIFVFDAAGGNPATGFAAADSTPVTVPDDSATVALLGLGLIGLELLRRKTTGA
jgi:hypothetical protein